MNFLFNLALFSLIIFGVFSMSIQDSFTNLFSWNAERTDQTPGFLATLQNTIQYGKSSVSLANISDNGTDIRVKTRVSLFTLLCDAIELFFKGNPYYEYAVQSILQYTDKMICLDIGSTTYSTSYKMVKLLYVLSKDFWIFNRLNFDFI